VPILSPFRPLVDRFLPSLSIVYREARDQWTYSRRTPKPTPYGVKLMGHADMESGRFEREETELARRLMLDCDVFVDVGANIGLYTCLACAQHKHAIAVEPLTRNLEYLYANLRANGFDDVEVFPVGLSDSTGLATLFGGATGASLIRGWADAPGPLVRTIPISTLDTLLTERFDGRRLLIKIDVEGAELGVLRGATKTLSRLPPPVWIVEVTRGDLHPGGVNAEYDRVFQRFEAAGYVASSIEGGGSNYVFRYWS
jgi:FkbM family methyltransferase